MFREIVTSLGAAALALSALAAPANAHVGHDHHDHGTSTLPDRFNPCGTINYAVNAAQAKPGALNDVKAAMARIHRETGLTFKYVGATRLLADKPYPRNVHLIIEWVKPGQGGMDDFRAGDRYAPAGWGGYRSQTGYLKDGKRAGRIYQGSVSINSTRQTYPSGFTPSRTGTTGSRGQLLVHEIGHAIGMDHTNNRSDIMYPVMTHLNANASAADKRQFRAVGKAGGCIYADDPMYKPAPEPTYAPEPEPTSGDQPTESPSPRPTSTTYTCYHNNERVPCDVNGKPVPPSPSATPTNSASPGPTSAPAGTPGFAVQAFDGVNDERVKAGLPPLRWLGCARDSAQRHSQRMADTGSFDHQTAESIRAACEVDALVGENIAYTTRNESPGSHAVTMWMTSEGHRAAILEPRFTHAGMGHVRAADGRHYFTQVFYDLHDHAGGF